MRAVRGVVGGVILTLVAGCVTQSKQVLEERKVQAPASTRRASVAALATSRGEERRYMDPDLGFEISRPDGSWQLDANDDITPDGLAIPVVLRHRESGAQVVLQVAPAVATPAQFAERLTDGLRSHAGVMVSDPEPLPLADGAVGFQFAMGEKVSGRVAVLDGGKGQVFMMLATWPSDAPPMVLASVEEIFGSLKPLPRN